MLPVFQIGDSTEVAPNKLVIPKARQLATLTARGVPFVRLIRCERHTESGYEAVVVEVEVELGQKVAHPIKRFEPLAFVFDSRDELQQEIWALRKGFPITPHQRLSLTPEPRSLCLYEEPYAEQKTRWSAFGLVERARDWLRLTARGELHEDDQPLEPLLGQADATAILPHNFYDLFTGKDFIPSKMAYREGAGNEFLLVLPESEWNSATPPDFVISLFVTPPVLHGIITHQPANLLDLHRFCQTASFDLLKHLRDRIDQWKRAGNKDKFGNSKLTLCIVFPKARRAGGAPESREIWLFATRSTLFEIGVMLGIVDKTTTDGYHGYIIGQTAPQTDGADKIVLLPMRPTFRLDRAAAATLSGTTPDQTKVLAIGLGALGSHVFDNLLKSGFGSWTLVDKDCLLPHNGVRHVLGGPDITCPKVEAMRTRATNLLPDVPITAIVADILEPGDKADLLNNSLKEADVILDMSAATAVSNHLALDCKAAGRRASTFLNPSGDTLVVLIEDSSRKVTLDWLEMHYYKALSANSDLADHFRTPTGFRYSRSCGDITSRISQDLIGLQSAIASRALRDGLKEKEAVALLFREQPDHSTIRHAISVTKPVTSTLKGWTILTNPGVLTEAHRLRKSKLPNETGGVLLGRIDTFHRRIYVMDLLPSPSDSHEWPTLYIRGVAGLRDTVQGISKASYNNIDYIGEWHSHPPGSSSNTSTTDKIALSKLAEDMSLADFPALMLIVADGRRHKLHILAGADGRR